MGLSKEISMKMVKIVKGIFLAIVAIVVAISILPIQAFASVGNSVHVMSSATASDYQLYQEVVDRLNNEYGSDVGLLPLAEYELQGLPLPRAATPEGIIEFEKGMRDSIEQAMISSFIAECECIKAYLDPTCTYSYGILPAFNNTTPWAIEMMVSVVKGLEYNEDVIQYIAEQNSVFADAVGQIPISLNSIGISAGNVQNCDDYDENVVTRGIWSVTYSIYQIPGTAKLSSLLTNNNTIWQWTGGASFSYTASILFPRFIMYSITSKSLISTSTIWDVTYNGELQSLDPLNGVLSFNYNYNVNIKFGAGSAAIQAGLV